MPRKHRRPNNIRRSKDSQARSGSHSSTEELTESLLHSHDEEEGNDEEEVILNNQVRPYPAISKETQVKKERIPEKSSHKSNHKKEKKLVENHSVESSIAKDDFEESFSAPINLDFPENPAQIATFEVEDPVKLDTASSREKKKHFLSGKPLIGLYDRPQSNAKTNNTPDTLANRWLKAQQPKHNEIFHQQDTIENYNVDRSDNTPVYDIKGRSGEGEAFNTLLDKHFSHSTAVRHFNESMPVFVLCIISLICSRCWFFQLDFPPKLENLSRVIQMTELNQRKIHKFNL